MSPLVLHPAAAPVPSPARPWLGGVQAGRQAWSGCPDSQPAARPACLPACLAAHTTVSPSSPVSSAPSSPVCYCLLSPTGAR